MDHDPILDTLKDKGALHKMCICPDCFATSMDIHEHRNMLVEWVQRSDTTLWNAIFTELQDIEIGFKFSNLSKNFTDVEIIGKA